MLFSNPTSYFFSISFLEGKLKLNCIVLNTSESNIRNYKKGKYPILTAFEIQMALRNNYSIDWIMGKSNSLII